MTMPRTDVQTIPKDKDPALGSQLQYFRAVIGKLDGAQQNYWTSVWEPAVEGAFKKVKGNRTWFYSLQGASTSAAVIVPALVGLNLSGEGGGVVRWITFAIGLAGALTSSAIQLFRFGSRWRLNRDYYSQLLLVGRAYILGGATPDDWDAFRKSADTLIANYDQAYDAEVISAVQPTTSKTDASSKS